MPPLYVAIFVVSFLRSCSLVHCHRKVFVDVATLTSVESKPEVANSSVSACRALRGSKVPKSEKLRDPDYSLKYWLQLKAKKKLPLNLEIVTRPVSARAREIMCAGRGVGKGLDIKGKSSLSQNANRGFVPYCQACAPDAFGKKGQDDLYFGKLKLASGRVINKFLVGSEWKGRFKAKGQFKGFPNASFICRSRNANLSPTGPGKKSTNLCRATRRSSDKELQHKVADSMKYKGKGSPNNPKKYPKPPPGVESRIIMMRPHIGNGLDQLLPFIGYRTEDQSSNTGYTIKPVVSDYDILTIAECPVPKAEGLRRYPLYNGDSVFFGADLFVRLVKTSFEKYSIMVDEGKTWLSTVHPEYDASVAAMMARLPKDFEGLGLGDLSSMIELKKLVDFSRELSKSGAIRHGAEAFNYIFPQPFAAQEYPRFTSADGRITHRLGLEGVIFHYKDLLSRGCCAPMNYLWLLYEKEGPQWIRLWNFAMTLVKDGTLAGCPFYDYTPGPDTVASQVNNLLKLQEKISKEKAKRGGLDTPDFEDLNGDGFETCEENEEGLCA